MRITKIVCDHCGKEISEMHDYCDVEVFLRTCEEVDLCKDCYYSLDEMIKAYVKKGGAE